MEDNHLIIINKSGGDLVQGDNTGDKSLIDILKTYLKRKYNKQGNVFLGVIHRLDRPVSGIVIFAKTSKALSRMSDKFRNHEIKKTYWAIVTNKPPKEADTIISWLKKNKSQNKSYTTSEKDKNAKKASLSYKLIAFSDRYYLLEIQLHTGRHHQIRCQLSDIGCPIKGDLKYGARRSNKDGNISLFSRKVSFTHPITKENITITAPIPQKDIWNLFDI